MPFEYEGPLVTPITLFRALLASSQKFQEWSESASVEAAHQKTWPMLAGPTVPPPIAIVALGRDFSAQSIATGTEDTWRDGGAVEIEFIGPVRDRADVPLLQQDLMAHLQAVNDILTDLRRLGVEGQHGYVNLKAFTLADDMYLAPEDAEIDFVGLTLVVSYGF